MKFSPGQPKPSFELMTCCEQLFAARHRLFLRSKEGSAVLTSLAFIFLVGLSMAAICQRLRLPRIIGKAKAKEMLFTGKQISAEEAERIGLVNSVVPGESLMKTAMELARKIARNGQIAVQQCKRAVNTGMQIDMQSAMDLELQIFSLCGATEDKQIGMGAFVRKETEKHFVNR